MEQELGQNVLSELRGGLRNMYRLGGLNNFRKSFQEVTELIKA